MGSKAISSTRAAPPSRHSHQRLCAPGPAPGPAPAVPLLPPWSLRCRDLLSGRKVSGRPAGLEQFNRLGGDRRHRTTTWPRPGRRRPPQGPAAAGSSLPSWSTGPCRHPGPDSSSNPQGRVAPAACRGFRGGFRSGDLPTPGHLFLCSNRGAGESACRPGLRRGPGLAAARCSSSCLGNCRPPTPTPAALCWSLLNRLLPLRQFGAQFLESLLLLAPGVRRVAAAQASRRPMRACRADAAGRAVVPLSSQLPERSAILAEAGGGMRAPRPLRRWSRPDRLCSSLLVIVGVGVLLGSWPRRPARPVATQGARAAAAVARSVCYGARAWRR